MVVVGALFVVGCTSADEPAGTGGPSSSEPTEPTESAPTPSLSVSGVPAPSSAAPAPGDPGAILPAELLERVLADAASRTGLPRAQVNVTNAVRQSWNDGALGCPEPGMVYVQVVSEGYQIMVSAGDQILDYRTSDRGVLKVCGKG